MLKPLIGSTNKERVLLFLYCREEGYAAEISRFFKTGLAPVQLQLRNLEEGGILVSIRKGKTLVYQFNPRYPFLKELRSLLGKSLGFHSAELREQLLMSRRRPRKPDKPL